MSAVWAALDANEQLAVAAILTWLGASLVLAAAWSRHTKRRPVVKRKFSPETEAAIIQALRTIALEEPVGDAPLTAAEAATWDDLKARLG